MHKRQGSSFESDQETDIPMVFSPVKKGAVGHFLPPDSRLVYTRNTYMETIFT